MNNEEQIISMLTNLTATVETLVSKVDKLETGQAKLEAGQAKLEAGQATLESRVNDIHNTLAVMQVENKEAHGAIFDKWDLIDKKADVLIVQQPITENRLENHDLRLKRLEKRVLAG